MKSKEDLEEWKRNLSDKYRKAFDEQRETRVAQLTAARQKRQMAPTKNPKARRSTPAWSDVKAILSNHDRNGLLMLVADLYNLSKENKQFLHARFAVGEDPAKKYKDIISTAMHPDIYSNKGVQIAKAKQAISDYVKAVGQGEGEIDLMIYFVEQGTDFTANFGDINAPFYDALLTMYARATKKVKALPEEKQAPFRERLSSIVSQAARTGWGYGDGVREMYWEAFEKDEE